MSSKFHLQIFTTEATTRGESTFTLFPGLPKELRQKIWRHSLERQRIIKIQLLSKISPSTIATTDLTVSRRNNEHYVALVDGYQVMSKLFRVSTEARDVASLFYRVHLPCRLTGKPTGEHRSLYGRGTKSGILHFNPEYDFLHLSPRTPVSDTLVDFLYHLRHTHDPKHVGLLNLATDINDLNANDHHLLQPGDLDATVREAFTATLAQLQEVFFVSTPRAGRQILGYMSGLFTSETILNRSFPIVTRTPVFERLHRDPRAISEDLKNVLLGTSDQRSMVRLWQRMLTKWGVSAPGTKLTFLLAFEPMEQDEICDRGSAERWLRKEDNVWTGVGREYRDSDIKWPVGAEHPKYKNEDLETAVRPALGFWLFPVDALGPLKEDGVSVEEGFRAIPKRIMDMSAYWPELALSSLP